VFDVGIQTSEALIALKNGKSPFDTGLVRPDGKGNGALMRVLPLALWHQGSDASLIEDAHTQSQVTHGHPCNQVCCALYCIWARRMLDGLAAEEAYLDAVATLRDLYPADSPYRQELEWAIRPDERIPSRGSGYVIDGLRCAREVLDHKSYEQVVKSAIALGDDTDTNAAIAGGLAGIRDGLKGIPERWINALRGKELATPLLQRLLDQFG
jgi:ADP-ribosylglycohydrolase